MDAHKKLVENVAIRLMHECTCIFLSVHMFLKSCACSSFNIQFPFEWPHVLQPRMPSHIVKKMCTFPYMLIIKKSQMLFYIQMTHPIQISKRIYSLSFWLPRGHHCSYFPRLLQDRFCHIPMPPIGEEDATTSFKHPG